ncbi:MAG: hypothetical protein KDA93_26715, partial [Planctomycetaceae bacterium]|nr:hypothetical protein [Planctomycetaceae bacterium]
VLETHLQPSSRFVVEEVMIVEFRDVLHAFLFIHGLSGRTSMFHRIKRSVSRWLKFTPSRRLRRGRRGPGVEILETRVLLAMRVWDGGATLNDRWTDPTNWKDNIAPVAGDDLVFPLVGINPGDLSTRNDFPANTVFNDITIEGNDYKLTGNRITLNGDILLNDSQGARNTEIHFDIRFSGGDHEVRFDFVAGASELTFRGALSSLSSGTLSINAQTTDPSAPTKRVVFSGSSANTYANPIFVVAGKLILDKPDNVPAVAGPLFVDDLGFVSVGDENILGGDRKPVGQFLPGVPVTLTDPNPNGDLAARLQIVRETLGAVSLNRTRILIDDQSSDVGGALTLTGDLTSTNGGSIGPSEFGPTAPSSQIVFSPAGGARTMNVSNGNLTLNSALIGGTLHKTGAGTLRIQPRRGANSFSGLTIQAGDVQTIQRFPNQLVLPGNIDIGGFGGGVTQLSVSGTVRALPSDADIDVRSGGRLVMTTGEEVIRRLNITDGAAGSRLFEMLLTVTEDVVVARTPTFIARSATQLNIGDDLFLTSTGLSVEESSQVSVGDALILRGADIALGAGSSVLLGGNLTANADGSNGAASTFKGTGTLFLKPGVHDFTVADGAPVNDLEVRVLVRTEPLKNVGSASFVKRGLGRMLQSATDQHGGPTTISAGEYRLNGVLQTSLLSVANGGRLSGIGQARNVVLSSGARFGPGEDGVGQFRANDFSFLFGSIFTTQLTSATSFDQLQTQVLRLDQFAVNGDVLFPILDVQTTATFPLGTAFKIVDVTGTGVPDLNKTFETPDGTPLPDGANFLVNGQNFTIDYNGGDGNDVVITRNNAPAFQDRKLTPVIFEGGIATLSGRITEPNAGDTFFLDVDWGDGNRETFTFGPRASRNVRVRHRYLEDSDSLVNNRYTVNVQWRDQHGGGNQAQLAIRVLNTRPNLTRVHALRLGDRLVQLTGTLHDVLQHDTRRVFVQWNPGGRYELLSFPAGSTNLDVQHAYSTHGIKRIKLLVSDDQHGIDIRGLTVRV